MFSTDSIFRKKENLVDNQKCQAGFRPLCNKILILIKKNLDFRFGDLVRDMWSPSTSKTIAPIKMRWTISRYSQNFSGFQQQDSQGKLLWFFDRGLCSARGPRYIFCQEHICHIPKF